RHPASRSNRRCGETRSLSQGKQVEMAKTLEMPKLSPTMEEGQIGAWKKAEGDSVEVDDLLAEVETDKATMEFRSFDKGVLLKQLAPEGATLQPDQPVAIFGNKGDDIGALLKQ